ncbi:MAG TPA: BMP family ABC transporter substrate-binding protein [Lachnospiraceae bacterium]|nr:BMP family ABC transporter substrate-binding protein [Lachnospiraceae bacterium]
MASEEYLKAQKSGKAAYRKAIAQGEYPYLPALDEIVDSRSVRTEEPLGLVSIPLDQVVGTKTAGRQAAFASNFMPLMPDNSEFARKWEGVVKYHLDQGVGDPIVAYEYMNRFYVLEGNKRVSVLKYFHADSIEGMVTRMVPYPQDSIENQIYYEFMDFYKDSQINYLSFSKRGSFAQLTEAIGKKTGEKWTDDEKMDFRSLYNRFAEIFHAKGGESLGITAGDALLFYLSLYPYDEVRGKSTAEMKADVEKIWQDLPATGQVKTNESMVFKPSQDSGGSIFTRFFGLHKVGQLKVAFIHDRPAELSSWAYTHELGRMQLEHVFGDKIHTDAYFLKESSSDISELIESVIASGYHLIFTTSTRFLAASLKASIEHPEVKILNCSVGQPYRTLRTYFGRLFEAKFLCGMIAGAMTPNDKIGYQAPLPNYGSIADINAFALGAQMTNPRAKVYLHWSSQTDTESFQQLIERENIRVVSDSDMITPASKDRSYGLYMTGNGLMQRLATPIWNWGRFYERIIRDFLQGNWDSDREVKEKPAINYWWGISSGIIDLIMSDELPRGIETLTNIVKGQMYVDYFNPFWGQFHKQDGSIAGRKDESLTPEEIITMDYLADGVIGSIPKSWELTADAREKVELQGRITPAMTTVE